MSRGHNCSADHWSLGIIIYENGGGARFTMKEWIKCLSTRGVVGGL
jgi:hypothetical protein